MSHHSTRIPLFIHITNLPKASKSSDINSFKHIYLQESSLLGVQPNQEILRFIKDSANCIIFQPPYS